LRQPRPQHASKSAVTFSWLPAADAGRALELGSVIAARLRELGYAWVSLDLEPLRSGRMNRVLGRRHESGTATPP
jgi:hypothetical protein